MHGAYILAVATHRAGVARFLPLFALGGAGFAPETYTETRLVSEFAFRACRLSLGARRAEVPNAADRAVFLRCTSRIWVIRPGRAICLYRRSRNAICAGTARDGLDVSFWAMIASRAFAGARCFRLIAHVVAVAEPEWTRLPVRVDK